jgi:hypothetical protein
MLTINTTGQAGQLAAQLRGLVASQVPVVTAKALTFVAQRAQAAVVARMAQAFDRPTRYTLGALRLVPAKPQALSARVAVKDIAPAGGTLPQDYLLPEVDAGPRKAKRFERALRYAGVLGPRGFAVLGSSMTTDAAGNLPRGELQRVLAAARAGITQRAAKRGRGKSARQADYFVAGLANRAMAGGELVRARGSSLQPGVYKRVGRGVLPVLIFTNSAPKYRQRLPFEQLARDVAEREMPAAFERAWRATIKAA